MYEILFAEGVTDDLRSLVASQRTHVLDQIELQLRHEPTRATRNRQILRGLVPPWEHVVPVWELRVGEHRVFYDVDQEKATVIVRAIRHKPPHQVTEEIL